MTDHLNDEQKARAEALHAARQVLAARSPVTAAAVDPTEVHSLAVFILDGGDPWALDEVKTAGDEGEGRVGVLTFEEHALGSKGASHGFHTTRGFEVEVRKEEGCRATCTVRHDGRLLFDGDERDPRTLLPTFDAVRSAEEAGALIENARLRRENADLKRDLSIAEAQVFDLQRSHERLLSAYSAALGRPVQS